jgi:hypothetical protein
MVSKRKGRFNVRGCISLTLVSFVYSGANLLFRCYDRTCSTGLCTLMRQNSAVFFRSKKNSQLTKEEKKKGGGEDEFRSGMRSLRVVTQRTIQISRILGNLWSLGLLADDRL